MQELIEKLENADEGSIELDARIWAWDHNVEFKRAEGYNRFDPYSYVWYTEDGKRYTCWWHQSFTRLVDAAISLIPDNESYTGKWTWVLQHPGYDDGVLTDEYRCTIHHPLSSGGGPEYTGFSKTAPLAICIAALKAISEFEAKNK